jgi:hypothetical protein
MEPSRVPEEGQTSRNLELQYKGTKKETRSVSERLIKSQQKILVGGTLKKKTPLRMEEMRLEFFYWFHFLMRVNLSLPCKNGEID